MKAADRSQTTEDRTRRPASRPPPAVLRSLCSALAVFVLAGCAVLPFRREPPRPGRTALDAPLVVLPTRAVGNHLVVEARWDRYGPYHFLVDTGSSVTLVTPALARRYPTKAQPPPATPRVRVMSADGTVAELPAAWLRRLELGEAKFDDVPVLVYDCAAVSAHLGVKIDGVLGFPLFRELILTLDYPGTRVLLQPGKVRPIIPGTPIPFDDGRKTPVIHVRLGARSLVALIDSGSDAGFSLNPVGLEPRFLSGPRSGATVGTLAGERPLHIGRLADPLAIGGYVLPEPIVDLSDELSAIGGGVLRNFSVTFDQEHDRVTFYRDSPGPIRTGPRRSAGVSFTKTPAYWKIAGVVHDSPAEAAGVRTGDLVTRINGEPVAKWDLARYEQTVATADEIAFTFLHGPAESSLAVPVFDLVP